MAARVGKGADGPQAGSTATETAATPAGAPVEPGDPDEALAGVLTPKDQGRWAYVSAVLEQHGVQAEAVQVEALLPDLIAVLVMADPDAARAAVEQAEHPGREEPVMTEDVVAELHADQVWTAIAHASATGRCNCRYLLRRLAPLFGRTVDETYVPPEPVGL